MYEQKLTSLDQLPIRQSNRRCTDILCTIVGGLFAITLFIVALGGYKKQNFYLTNYPTDSDNVPCGLQRNHGFNYVYIPNIKLIDKRVCVSSCPRKQSLGLLCQPNSLIQNCISVYIYGATASDGRLPGFCLPDDQKEREVLQNQLNLHQKRDYLELYDISKLSLLISLGVSLVYFVMAQFLARYIVGFMFFISGLICLAIAGMAIFVTQQWSQIGLIRIFICISFLFLGVYTLLTLCLYKKKTKVAGIFLSHAKVYNKNYATQMLWIPLFLALTLGLIILVLFQYIAFSSIAEPVTSQKDIYLHCRGNPILTFLCIIEFIWGLQFLKDAFNFIIAGNASEWYIREGKLHSILRDNLSRKTHNQNCCRPLSRLLCMNWGSVVGGSFLNAFLSPLNFIFQIFRCYPDGACSSLSKQSSACSYICCNNMCDLIRTDSYTYINLTGIPYCNASRNCQALINNSDLFIGSQSVTYFYRFCIYIFCIGISTIISYFLINGILSSNPNYEQIYHPNAKSIIILILLSYSICTYFADYHTDIAQAFQISYLIQNQFSGLKKHSSQMREQLKNVGIGERDGEF